MKACIIANGNIKNNKKFSKIITQADIIICADGGANHLKNMGILPHVIIGDLDSINFQDKSFFKKNNIKFIKHPVDKDATDTELAADYAIKEKACDITFIGVSGSRLDHTLANIFLLKKITAKNIKCKIIDDNNEIFIVTDKLTVTRTTPSFISIIPLTEKAEGVSTTGLKFPLTNDEIKFGTSIGISNEFLDNKATISVKKGVLIVTKSID
ncbi:MAG: thiamine diphosphokinase [Desulfobacteraceae bacterium]|nr:thiamine diphosphokinase [Desulfobacteraceae bacterium]